MFRLVRINHTVRLSSFQFIGCSAYKKYLQKKEEIKESARENKLSASENVARMVNTPTFVEQGRTYASFLSGDPNVSLRETGCPTIISEFLRIARKICRSETSSLEERIKSFIRRYRSFSREEARSQCLEL